MGHHSSIKESVISLWNEGYSAGRIVIKMSEDGNTQLTRNGVIGIVTRWRKASGTPPRRSPTITKAYPMMRAVPVKHPEVTTIKGEPETIGPIADFPGRACCKYMPGPFVPNEWQFCGHPTKDVLTPYCDFHTKIAKGRNKQTETEDEAGS